MQPLEREVAVAASSRSARGRPVARVVEDILIRFRPGLQNIRIAGEQKEIWRLGARCIDEAGPVPLGQLFGGERLKPGQPAEFFLRECDRLPVLGMRKRCLGHRIFSDGAGCQHARKNLRLVGIDTRARRCTYEDAKARDDTDLEGQEGDELRQRHDIRGRPAGIEQRLQRGRARIARMEDQHMRMLEGGGEPGPETLPSAAETW